jgi:hypothetical protein
MSRNRELEIHNINREPEWLYGDNAHSGQLLYRVYIDLRFVPEHPCSEKIPLKSENEYKRHWCQQLYHVGHNGAAWPDETFDTENDADHNKDEKHPKPYDGGYLYRSAMTVPAPGAIYVEQQKTLYNESRYHDDGGINDGNFA